MAENNLVFGVPLNILKQGIQAHELQGFEDRGPYIFTNVSKKKVGTSSSAFGPGQIVGSTVERLMASNPDKFKGKFKQYALDFIQQGGNKLNLDYYERMYKDGKPVTTTDNDKIIFGPLGEGSISPEDHAKHYDTLWDLVLKEKINRSDNLEDLLKRYHGDTKEQKNINYAASVLNKLDGLGIQVPADSAKSPFPKKSKTTKKNTDITLPKVKPEKEQNIDQEGPIKDTGEEPSGEPLTDEQIERNKAEALKRFDKPVDVDTLFGTKSVDPELMNRVIETPAEPKKKRSFFGLFDYNEGGVVPMERQMSMFEDGGLMDEGGTVDPVSGNDVPPGSTQEEVRDDIPAQLSEGEFVFPADVVRYIGLGNLMRMRQEAKMGLKMMEEMGQMGNSEEATMPDDLPFDINDLDMEDEPEYNVGGYVPPITAATQQQEQMGISGFQQAAAPTTGVAAVPQQAASQQYVQPAQPVQAAVPTMQAYKPSEVPTFQQTIGDDAFGTYDELRQYRNETGNIINVPFRNGQPISPIPEGYTFVDPEETATEEVTTTPTTPQTTQVREEGGNDEARQRREEEMYGPGGGRVGVDGKIYGVSFDMPEGFMPGMGASISTALSLATGEPLPEGVTVNFKRDDVEFSMTSEEYNDFKSTARKFGYNSKEASQKLNELGREEAEKEAKIAQQIEKARKVEDNMARAAQKIEDKKERDAALLEVAKRREERSIYGTGGDDTGTKGQGYSVGSKTDKGSGATDRGFGGTGRGRSDAPGMAAADVRSGSSYGTSPPEGPMGSISGRPRAKGGLMEAPKSKAKKMKRGGLASKK